MDIAIISKTFQTEKVQIDIDFSLNQTVYLNATKVAYAFNKDLSNWKRSKQTTQYIDVLLSSVDFTELKLTENDLFKVVLGKGKDQGTWIHKSLIILFARWLSPEFAVWCDLQIEEILKGSSTPKDSFQQRKEQFQLDVIGLESSFKLLRVNEASKILMTKTLYTEHGLSTSYLPKYSDEQHTYSLSHLLKKFEVGISAKKLNLILLSEGYLEIKTRKSTGSFIDEKTKEKKPKLRTFKSLTEKGLEFGKNVISPHNQLETQPHYFESKFKELIKVLKVI